MNSQNIWQKLKENFHSNNRQPDFILLNPIDLFNFIDTNDEGKDFSYHKGFIMFRGVKIIRSSDIKQGEILLANN